MFINEIRIGSFRHLENVSFGPFRPPSEQSDLIALAGPNGGGKTSVLELLGFALSNSWSLAYSMGRSFPTNSFEVSIGLTHEELKLVTADAKGSPEQLKYLEGNGRYYRGFNFAGGEYQKNANLYNGIHNLVTAALRPKYRRPLGFFIKSDRYYPSG